MRGRGDVFVSDGQGSRRRQRYIRSDCMGDKFRDVSMMRITSYGGTSGRSYQENNFCIARADPSSFPRGDIKTGAEMDGTRRSTPFVELNIVEDSRNTHNFEKHGFRGKAIALRGCGMSAKNCRQSSREEKILRREHRARSPDGLSRARSPASRFLGRPLGVHRECTGEPVLTDRCEYPCEDAAELLSDAPTYSHTFEEDPARSDLIRASWTAPCKTFVPFSTREAAAWRHVRRGAVNAEGSTFLKASLRSNARWGSRSTPGLDDFLGYRPSSSGIMDRFAGQKLDSTQSTNRAYLPEIINELLALRATLEARDAVIEELRKDVSTAQADARAERKLNAELALQLDTLLKQISDLERRAEQAGSTGHAFSASTQRNDTRDAEAHYETKKISGSPHSLDLYTGSGEGILSAVDFCEGTSSHCHGSDQVQETDTISDWTDLHRTNAQKCKYAEHLESQIEQLERNLRECDVQKRIFAHRYNFMVLDLDGDGFLNIDEFREYDFFCHYAPAVIERLFAMWRVDAGSQIFGGDLLNASGRICIEDFVQLCMWLEDRNSREAVPYLFRVLDLDGDGIINVYDLRWFYDQITDYYAELLPNVHVIKFEDLLCQMMDMLNVPACRSEMITPQRNLFDQLERKDFGITLAVLRHSALTAGFIGLVLNHNNMVFHRSSEEWTGRNDGVTL